MTVVKQIDIKAIFEKQAGHKIDEPNVIIVCDQEKARKVIAGNLGEKK